MKNEDNFHIAHAKKAAKDVDIIFAGLTDAESEERRRVDAEQGLREGLSILGQVRTARVIVDEIGIEEALSLAEEISESSI